MPDRRSLIGAGLMAGFGAAAGVEGAAPPQSGKDVDQIVAAIGQLRKEMATFRDQSTPGYGIVETIRQHQRTFLKAAQKYPDYMDVGVRAWEAICDWHARFYHQWNVTRQPDGRYSTNFLLTTFILRPEQTEEYIGLPYDKDR
ncbi:MAG: hypothetical protein ACRD09_08720 [Vicinamibacterales bacterium]